MDTLLTNKASRESEKEYVSYGISASWRQGDWERLKKFVIMPHKPTFETLLGSTFHSFFSNDNRSLESKVNDAFKELTTSHLDTYDRGYESYVKLHIFQEMASICHIYDQLNFSGDSMEMETLFRSWDQRLEITRPSIRYRELILNTRIAILNILT